MIHPVFAQAAPSGGTPAPAAAPAPAATTQYTTEQQQPAADPQAQPQPGVKDGLLGMAPFIIIVVVMFYLMYRGQKKEQKRRQEMIDGVKKGDTVLTVGGIYGEIVEIHDDRFLLKIADGVKISVAKTAISTTPGKSDGEKTEKK